MRTSFTVIGDPIGKPRMSRRDVWQKRACVVRYRAWCDSARMAATGNPSGFVEVPVLGVVAFAHIGMPASWSAAKKTEHAGKLHRGKPDADNIGKAVLDALLAEDKGVAFVTVTKCWCEEGQEPRTDVFLLVP